MWVKILAIKDGKTIETGASLAAAISPLLRVWNEGAATDICDEDTAVYAAMYSPRRTGRPRLGLAGCTTDRQTQ